MAMRGIAPALRGGAMAMRGIAPALRGGAMAMRGIAPALRGGAMAMRCAAPNRGARLVRGRPRMPPRAARKRARLARLLRRGGPTTESHQSRRRPTGSDRLAAIAIAIAPPRCHQRRSAARRREASSNARLALGLSRPVVRARHPLFLRCARREDNSRGVRCALAVEPYAHAPPTASSTARVGSISKTCPRVTKLTPQSTGLITTDRS
jgi:hypothetical protein